MTPDTWPCCKHCVPSNPAHPAPGTHGTPCFVCHPLPYQEETMTREELQARAIRLRQSTYGLAADLDGYPHCIAVQAAELLSYLDSLLAEDTE